MNRFDFLRDMKRRGEQIAVLTAYDYPTARLLDEAGVDLILVGDSLGMVVLGFPDTTLVTLDHMLHHTAAVRRAVQRAPVIADLPFGTYETVEDALKNSRALVAAGADAVKLEGGVQRRAQIAAIVEAGTPVMGHIGMLPQSVREEGGYRIKGKTEEGSARLHDDAHAVESAGAFGMVVELVQSDTAARITRSVTIPTIGIGAGSGCDGQVLVSHDLIGFFPWFTPKFVKPRANIAEAIRNAARGFIEETKG
jgi:3-methyl-2-oxobutanoate hydroxymethyltransferase